MDVCGFILIICLSSCVSVRDTKDKEETLCAYNESCVLPCRFTPGSDLHIQWTKRDRDLTVHSFHHGQNQILDQYLDYRGRTSLFEEEMITGNASLLLKEVTVKDQGRYLCLANGNVTYVNMKVFAPVSEVHVYSIGGSLYCHASHIYPEPSLKWTMDPEPSADPEPSVYPTETGLFSVYSCVPLPPDPPYEYICIVSTEHSTNNKTYERNEKTFEDEDEGTNFVFFWVICLIAVSAALVVCHCYMMWKRKNRLQAISSKFTEMWKEFTDGDPRADAETVDVPNPEEEHLEPNISEEAETEL